MKRTPRRAFLFVAACILVSPALLRAEFPAAAIDRYLDGCAARGEFNGVVLVARKGVVQYHRALGTASMDGARPLKKESVFRLASVAKAFTSMSILMLRDEGKLSLDDDVRKYVPTLPYAGATIRHLLHHTSGLPDYVKLLDEYWDAEEGDLSRRKFATNPDALGQLIKHKPPVRFAPGKRWDYSNTGYMLLALVVEKISGERFSDFLTRRIFAPFGMKETVLFTPITPPVVERRAWGYRLAPDGGERRQEARHVGVATAPAVGVPTQRVDRAHLSAQVVDEADECKEHGGSQDHDQFVLATVWRPQFRDDHHRRSEGDDDGDTTKVWDRSAVALVPTGMVKEVDSDRKLHGPRCQHGAKSGCSHKDRQVLPPLSGHLQHALLRLLILYYRPDNVIKAC